MTGPARRSGFSITIVRTPLLYSAVIICVQAGRSVDSFVPEIPSSRNSWTSLISCASPFKSRWMRQLTAPHPSSNVVLW